MEHIVCGAINWDTTIFVRNLPREGEEVRVDSIITVPGGKGANIAVASARLLGKGKVRIFGALGSDEIAEEQTRVLNDEGVNTALIWRMKNVSSGQAYIIVDQNGKNSIMTFKKANDMLTEEYVDDPVIGDAIESCKLITVVDPPLQAAKKLITSASKHGKITVWAPGLLSGEGIQNRDVMRHVDFLILNEQESLAISKISDSALACSEIAKRTGSTTIVTTGKSGCILCEGKDVVFVPTVDLESRGMRIKNTTGAGDAFIGTFSSMKILGKDNAESLLMANLAGSIKVTKNETRGGPTLPELLDFKNKNEIETSKAKNNN